MRMRSGQCQEGSLPLRRHSKIGQEKAEACESWPEVEAGCCMLCQSELRSRLAKQAPSAFLQWLTAMFCLEIACTSTVDALECADLMLILILAANLSHVEIVWSHAHCRAVTVLHWNAPQIHRTLREGPRYQAMIPAYIAKQPQYVEEQDKRRGRKTEAMDVMAAAPIEKMRADQLPFDAVSDPEFHRSDGGHPAFCCN